MNSDRPPDPSGSRKRRRSTSPTPASHGMKSIYRSVRIDDRASTFVALFSPVLSTAALQALPELASASHRMVAWRKPARQRSLSGRVVHETGSDDDGEKGAGKRLEALLGELDVEGAVVVGRWYGGVLLGPARWVHITGCARQAALGWKDAHEEKRAKLKEGQEKVRLVKTLAERDESLDVLRGLLLEKQGKLPLQEDSLTAKGRKIDYEGMSVAVLLKLEKARDKSIEWILGEIDKAEKSTAAGPDIEIEREVDKTNSSTEDKLERSADGETSKS